MRHPIEPAIELRQHGLRADEFGARRSQLDGQRKTIEPAADLRNVFEVFRRQLKVRIVWFIDVDQYMPQFAECQSSKS